MKWQLNTYMLFVLWVESILIILLYHLSYPNDKNWVLRIPHRLRDLLWMVRAWYSIASIFFFSSYESSWKQLLPFGIHSLHEWINDPGRPFKVAITTSTFSTSSSTASSCSAFWIFTFFNYFLKSIFWFKFLSSNSLIKEHIWCL